MFERLKKWARRIKTDVFALYLAASDPRVPWYAKALAAATAAYAFSPIDLIPDFIPILGYLDDAILVPLAILLVIKLIPPEVMADLRREAEQRIAREHPGGNAVAAIIILIWISLGILGVWLIWRRLAA